MSDDFTERFGQLDVAPRHVDNPNDPALALYCVHTRARRFVFENEPGVAWAVDTKTGERAFRVDAEGRTYLPDGTSIGTPRLTQRQEQSLEKRLYDEPAKQPAKSAAPPYVSDEERLAAALYGRK